MRWIQKGNKRIQQVLLRWSDPTMEEPTWKDYEDLKNRFPRSTAWGQAVVQERGIVSDPSHHTGSDTSSQGGEEAQQDPAPDEANSGRAQRVRKPNPRYTGDSWTK